MVLRAGGFFRKYLAKRFSQRLKGKPPTVEPRPARTSVVHVLRPVPGLAAICSSVGPHSSTLEIANPDWIRRLNFRLLTRIFTQIEACSQCQRPSPGLDRRRPMICSSVKSPLLRPWILVCVVSRHCYFSEAAKRRLNQATVGFRLVSRQRRSMLQISPYSSSNRSMIVFSTQRLRKM
jgi:hypothetical protein